MRIDKTLYHKKKFKVSLGKPRIEWNEDGEKEKRHQTLLLVASNAKPVAAQSSLWINQGFRRNPADCNWIELEDQLRFIGTSSWKNVTPFFSRRVQNSWKLLLSQRKGTLLLNVRRTLWFYDVWQKYFFEEILYTFIIRRWIVRYTYTYIENCLK